jgi:glutaredoxin
MGLTLYIKPWCPWCVVAVAWLEELCYAFDKINVLSDPMGIRVAFRSNHLPDTGNIAGLGPGRF